MDFHFATISSTEKEKGLFCDLWFDPSNLYLSKLGQLIRFLVSEISNI